MKGMKMEKFESVQKMKIPDDDMVGWINVLRDGGFSQEEIDSMLAHLNKTYREMTGNKIVEKELEDLREYLKKKHGKDLSQEQLEYYRKVFESKHN
jgi:hypothetical protein